MEEKVFLFDTTGKSKFINRIKYSYFIRVGEDITGRIGELLTFTFHDGKEVEYQVSGIGEKIFNDLSSPKCTSIGKYWHENIKNNSSYQYKIIRKCN